MAKCPECECVVPDGDSERWPKVAPAPAADDVVQVLMTEEMARRFERTYRRTRSACDG